MVAVSDDWVEIRKVMEHFRCSYKDFIRAVSWIAPGTLTRERMQEFLKKHRPIRSIMDSDGYLPASDAEQDLGESAARLRTYFHETDDGRLSKAMMRTYHNFFKTLEMVTSTGVHLWTSLMVYEEMNPGCWELEACRKTLNQLYSQR